MGGIKLLPVETSEGLSKSVFFSWLSSYSEMFFKIFSFVMGCTWRVQSLGLISSDKFEAHFQIKV